MQTQSVVFTNKELNLRLAGLLRLPVGFDLSKDYPAVVVTGPMLSIKEQAQSVYAEKLTELGYVTLVFDGSYFGENAWSRPSSQEIFDAVPHDDKEMAVIPIASHFDMYDLAPFVDQAFEAIAPFFERTL